VVVGVAVLLVVLLVLCKVGSQMEEETGNLVGEECHSRVSFKCSNNQVEDVAWRLPHLALLVVALLGHP